MSILQLVFALQVSAAPSTSSPPPATAAEEYEQRMVGFDDFAVLYGRRGAVLEWSRPYKGKYREPLEGSAFYAYVGRPDLAATYDERAAKKRALLVSGVVTSAVGLVTGFVGIINSNPGHSAFDYGVRSCFDPACVDAAQAQADRANADAGSTWRPVAYVGFGLAAVGFATWVAGIFVDPQPVGIVDARRLADAYNHQLRVALGLEPPSPPPEPSAPSSDEPGAHVSVVPLLVSGGAGLGLAASF